MVEVTFSTDEKPRLIKAGGMFYRRNGMSLMKIDLITGEQGGKKYSVLAAMDGDGIIIWDDDDVSHSVCIPYEDLLKKAAIEIEKWQMELAEKEK
ncbi:hypothetical protein CL614_00205 [archaeon]|nr:hypothetical protein [archaeon]|tara:strand:+ start:1228 stop:1512 length:285 start_codon:yes stop_codon:yes gene_type:complete